MITEKDWKRFVKIVNSYKKVDEKQIISQLVANTNIAETVADDIVTTRDP